MMLRKFQLKTGGKINVVDSAVNKATDGIHREMDTG
jgi:hypothetical protein